ncbi:DUF4268 domain-containing protein [Dokdonia sinensis]|uniref:DUF4268 domain-containing protein n=1 Tax=Dokdonia sinensis TaxID=2479847 RepID=A0A3M0GT06_9FLAO|nr:DUF4268 domain-containing protein [Dokdonia sinensis]RMB60456.1 DUF4268 domain-containing protein [Dokdonia sinensis]
MFSREEAKQIRQQFWIFFGKRYPRKWLLYNTRIKDFSLKFDFDNKRALVAIDSESNDEVFRAYYFDKLLSLKNLMKDEISEDLIFEEDYVLDNQKIISRCYLALENVSINNKHSWPEVFEFFHTYMSKMEAFFLEYEDFIKS